MTTRPNKFPRWASSDITENETGQANVVEPPEGKKDEGWDYKEKPPFNWFNWLLRHQHDWLAHMDEVANQFSAYEADPADYTVMIGPGNHRSGSSYNQYAERQTGSFSLPASDDRIDLVCLARADGSIVTVTGTEATTPSAPSVPANSIPLAEVYLTPGLAAITNAQITDRRPRIESHEELTNSGDPNGAVAARWPYDLCWDTSVSPAIPYVATVTDGTVGGTTWTPLPEALAKAPASTAQPHGTALATFSDAKRLTRDADGVLKLEDY